MKLQVLFIDDDAVTLFIHQTLAEDCGFPDDTLSFTKPTEALSFLKDNDHLKKTTLLFLDINMPLMNAWEFLDALKTMNLSNTIHVVLITSSINKRDKKTAEEYSQVIKFIEKPLEEYSINLLKKHALLAPFFNDK